MIAAAGVMACIAVDTGLQTFIMDEVDHGLEAVGEADLVDKQLSRFAISSTLEAIVDVDILIAGILEALGDHRGGLLLDEGLIDISEIGVPRAPAHSRTLGRGLCLSRQGERGGSQQCEEWMFHRFSLLFY